MKVLGASLVIFLNLLVSGGCGPDHSGAPRSTSNAAFVDTSPHRSAFVTVNGVRINYLDWSKPKDAALPTLILIHGLGASPHMFDELAPTLIDLFRVIAYARRGHGLSDAPTGPYDIETLVEDLRQFLDSLGIARANLLGWSMGGNEITAFAGRYPERVQRLVYLEAAYDWTDSTFQALVNAPPVPLAPSKEDLSSLDAYRAWYKATWCPDVTWSPGQEAYLRDITRLDADGRVRVIPDDTVTAALFASLFAYHRDYRKVQAPALALYATTFFSAAGADPARAQRIAAWERNMALFRQASKDRLRREMPHVVIVEVSNRCHESIGFLEKDKLAAIIKQFLLEAGLPEQSPRDGSTRR